MLSCVSAQSYCCIDRGHLRFALAGRSEAKLKAVLADMTRINERCAGWCYCACPRLSLTCFLFLTPPPTAVDVVALIVASASDSASLDAMAARTRVVLTTVGVRFAPHRRRHTNKIGQFENSHIRRTSLTLFMACHLSKLVFVNVPIMLIW